MIKNLLGLSIIAFICAFSVTELSAQMKTNEKSKSRVVIEKKIIEENGKIVSSRKVLEGKEAEEYIRNQENEEVEVEIDEYKKSSETTEKRKYKIISINDKGEKKEIEWNGEGDMPAEIKALIEKEGNLADLKSGDKKIKIIEKEKGQATQTREIKYGEVLPEDIRKLLNEKGIDIDSIMEHDGKPQVKIIKEKEKKLDKANPNKTKGQLGVAISKTMLGAQVTMVQPNSAAEEAGLKVADVITQINEVKITAPTVSSQPSEDIAQEIL